MSFYEKRKELQAAVESIAIEAGASSALAESLGDRVIEAMDEYMTEYVNMAVAAAIALRTGKSE